MPDCQEVSTESGNVEPQRLVKEYSTHGASPSNDVQDYHHQEEVMFWLPNQLIDVLISLPAQS